MPPAKRPLGTEIWSGSGEAWTYVTEHLAAIGVWAGIGYGLDRAFGTWPILFAIGALVGNGAGVYLLYRRSLEKERAERARREAAGREAAE